MKEKNRLVRIIVKVCLGCMLVALIGKEYMENGENITLEYVLGMLAGLIVGLLSVVILVWLIRKLGGKVSWNSDRAYDERQIIARGKAYQAAFVTLAFYMMIISWFSEMVGVTWFMSFGGMWIGLCLSILVFAVICILKDAYMSLYENTKGSIMLFTVAALSNLIIGIVNLTEEGSLIKDGVISAACVNLAVGLLFTVISIVFCGRVIYNKKHLEEDEE